MATGGGPSSGQALLRLNRVRGLSPPRQSKTTMDIINVCYGNRPLKTPGSPGLGCYTIQGMFRALLSACIMLASVSALSQNTSSPSGAVTQPNAQTSITGNADGNNPSQPSAPPDSKNLTLLKSAPVVYPEAAKNAGTQGSVVVKITANEIEDVESTSVVSGDPMLAAAVSDSLKQWKFQPFIKDGKPVHASISLPFLFEIADGECTNGVKQATVTTPADLPFKVSAKEMQLLMCKEVEPTYSQMAKLARITGSVVMSAIVAKDGTLRNIHVINSASPLLNQSAIDAVHKWRYHPYVVSGQAVEVHTTITITFQL